LATLGKRPVCCVVPGTGFGQKPGTAHFRTTILPPTHQIEEVIDAIDAFQRRWG